jgi:hypothetical protein
VNEEDLVNRAGRGVFLHRIGIRLWCLTMESAAIESRSESAGQETHMNVRTITTFILAVALMASAGGVYAAEQAGQGRPYTGPDTPVITTA